MSHKRTYMHLQINWSGNIGGWTQFYIVNGWEDARAMMIKQRIHDLQAMIYGEPNARISPKPRIAVRTVREVTFN